MTNSNYLIIFSKTDIETPLLGFRLFDKKEASQYMKCVNILSENNCVFDLNDTQVEFSKDDFEKIKISSAELKILNKIFVQFEESEKAGTFPDSISLAYDEGLISDDDDSEDSDYSEDSEDYY